MRGLAVGSSTRLRFLGGGRVEFADGIGRALEGPAVQCGALPRHGLRASQRKDSDACRAPVVVRPLGRVIPWTSRMGPSERCKYAGSLVMYSHRRHFRRYGRSRRLRRYPLRRYRLQKHWT